MGDFLIKQSALGLFATKYNTRCDVSHGHLIFFSPIFSLHYFFFFKLSTVSSLTCRPFIFVLVRDFITTSMGIAFVTLYRSSGRKCQVGRRSCRDKLHRFLFECVRNCLTES